MSAVADAAGVEDVGLLKALGLVEAHDAHCVVVVLEGAVEGSVGAEGEEEVESGAVVVAQARRKGVEAMKAALRASLEAEGEGDVLVTEGLGQGSGMLGHAGVA